MTHSLIPAPRRVSRPVHVGDVQVGGDAPIVVQSMTTCDTADIEQTMRQIRELAEEGCEIVRLAVPDREAAGALPKILAETPVPIIADIHFDHRLAHAAIKAGVHGLRLNPGNIRREEKVREIVADAKAAGIPIRVGVNNGSLPPIAWLEEGELPPPDWKRMVDAALWEVQILEDMGFEDIKVSLKSFNVPTMVQAYREFADLRPYPLHLGVTEAGTPRAGSVRSAAGIGILLAEGIGDTIRISLSTADSREEVKACYDLLKALELREKGATVIACPTCGRIEIDLIPLVNRVEEYFARRNKVLKVAVMGCVVNGPGEAKEADIGIAGGKGRGVIFRKGEVVRTCNENEFFEALVEEGERVIAEMEGDEPEPRKDGVIPLTVVN